MVSLKRFLNESEEEVALRKVVSLLLEKIGSDAVEGDQAGFDAFRLEMDRIRERLRTDVTAEILFLTAGSAVQAMENYNRRITAFLRKQGSELQCIVSMITETAIKLGGQSTRSAQRLQEIGDKFERAGTLNDLQALKSELSNCLHSFREEAQRQKAESDEAIQFLQKEIERRRDGVGTAATQDLDAVTGLPRQAAGVKAMQQAIMKGERRYVVVMVVNRIQSLNARFGFQVGDRILRVFKEHVQKQLMRTDKLFRWEGPAIVALIERAEPMEQVRAQMRRILDGQIEESFDAEGRSVMIPISASWSSFPLMPPLAGATKQIQTFIASQGSRDYV